MMSALAEFGVEESAALAALTKLAESDDEYMKGYFRPIKIVIRAARIRQAAIAGMVERLEHQTAKIHRLEIQLKEAHERKEAA